MKRTTATLGLLFTLAFAMQVSASESFTLNIPVRFNAQQETGEVRITLALDAAPAGAQLVVSGATTLNLGDTTSVGGDSVTFAAGTGNDVRITYRPLSNFVPPTDFCSGGSAVEKNIPMRFSGAQDVVEYRVTTYLVGAPDYDCSQVSKRTGDSPASLVLVDDGVAPVLVAENRGRHPLDVVLVLDKSGSMADFPPDAVSGAKKVEILKSALLGFLAAWRQIDQPTAGGGEWSQDRIGVVFFDSAAAAQTITGADPSANFFVQRGPNAPGPTHQWNAVDDNVNTLNPGGSTSVGGGINLAMSQWQSDPDHDLFILLVTDGIQNTAPLVETLPGGFLGLLPVAGFPQELRKRFVPIQTIGFGQPDSVDETLLRNISLQTSGVSYISVNATTMFDFLGSTLVSILKGNTVSIAMRRHDTMTGAGPSAPRPLVIDPSAQRVVFALQWAPPERDALDLEVFRPGAATAAAPTSGEKTPQAVLQSFDTSPADAGTWSVRVKRNGVGHDLPYTLNVFFLERHLDYRVAFDSTGEGTGDNIRLRATVAYDGKPLAGLPPGAIRVRVQRPPEGLGTILHNARFTDNGPATTPNGDVLTPYQRKLAQLDGVLDRTVARDVDTISLADAKNGVYTGTFDQTTTPGTYGFEIVLDWDDPRTGHLHREERLEQHVKVKPDPAKTEIETATLADNTMTVSVTPRDRFGSYLGPGYGHLVDLKLKGAGTLVERVDRDQTGTYEFTIKDVPANGALDADILVDGVNVGTPAQPPTPLSNDRFFIGAGPNFPHGNWSVNAGLERRLSPVWSVEGILGYHRSAVDVWQLSANGKRYFGATRWHPFLNAGVGAYRIDPGNTTKAGINAGAGILYDLSPTFGVEASFTRHMIHNDDFSTIEVGIRVLSGVRASLFTFSIRCGVVSVHGLADSAPASTRRGESEK
jgi:hypothetical protein